MIGDKIYKPLTDASRQEYFKNSLIKGALIEDKGDYYEVVATSAPSLEDLREAKLTQLKTAFKTIRDTAWVMSSLGFKADANDTANTDVEGLIKRMTALGETETTFCDFGNIERNVTLEGLHTLQLEIIMNGQYLYKQKWDIRDAIKATKTEDELEAIEIKFTMMDFSV